MACRGSGVRVPSAPPEEEPGRQTGLFRYLERYVERATSWLMRCRGAVGEWWLACGWSGRGRRGSQGARLGAGGMPAQGCLRWLVAPLGVGRTFAKSLTSRVGAQRDLAPMVAPAPLISRPVRREVSTSVA